MNPTYDFAEKELLKARALLQASTAPPERLHDLRVSLKKLRAVVRLLEEFEPEAGAKIQGDLRLIAKKLAIYRDQDIAAKARKIWLPTPPANKSRVVSTLGRGSRSDRGKAEINRSIHRLDELRPEIERLIENAWPGQDAIMEALIRSFRKCRRSWKKLRRSHSVAALHDLRKKAKTLMYQIEALAPKPVLAKKVYWKKLDSLAELIGEIHDQSVIETAFRGLAIAKPRLGHLHTQFRRRRKTLRKNSFAYAKKLFSEKPGAWSDRALSRHP